MNEGDVIGRRYRLAGVLGGGALGEVWSAEHVATGLAAAVKILRPERRSNPEAVARFQREMRITGRLAHPAFPKVYDVGVTSDGRPWMAIELIEGESLDAHLQRDGRLDPVTTCCLVSEVARGLDAAHRAGVVHRNLSPSNVLVTRDPASGAPRARVIDLGVCRAADDLLITAEGTLLGAPACMSPEQAEGAEMVDARSDVWALGVLVYRCLTRQNPFDARTATAQILAVMTREHRPLAAVLPEVDAELADLVEGCLVKDRDGRIGSALEVALRLEAVGHRLAALAGPHAAWPRRRATDRLPDRRSAPRIAELIPTRSAGLGFGGLVMTAAAGALVGFGLGLTLRGAPSDAVGPLSGAANPTRGAPEAAALVGAAPLEPRVVAANPPSAAEAGAAVEARRGAFGAELAASDGAPGAAVEGGTEAVAAARRD